MLENGAFKNAKLFVTFDVLGRGRELSGCPIKFSVRQRVQELTNKEKRWIITSQEMKDSNGGVSETNVLIWNKSKNSND